MRAVIQRVKHASCSVDKKITGKIDQGFLVLVGFNNNDTSKEIDLFVRKISGMRIFEDENGKMNLGLKDVGGKILSISQFTLYADCKRGNRPSFTEAANGEKAKPLYDEFNQKLRNNGYEVEEGIFGADMKIELLNDGPTTIILDSEEL